MTNEYLAPELDMTALVAKLEAFLSTPRADIWMGGKLCALLVRFIHDEMLPAATRVAAMDIDPTPIMETVAGVLRVVADNLGPPEAKEN
jgi:hypothetical protein